MENIKSVLVHGATGAIGSAAIQLLRHLNIDTDATCREEHIPLIQALGVRKVFDYQKEDFTLSSKKYDLIFDSVEKSSYWHCRKVMNPKGIYISSELGDRGENPFLALWGFLGLGRRVVFPLPTKILRSLKFVEKLLASGEFRPLIDKTLKLENIREAFQYVRKGQKVGNVVLNLES